jgi:hypothetical protein
MVIAKPSGVLNRSLKHSCHLLMLGYDYMQATQPNSCICDVMYCQRKRKVQEKREDGFLDVAKSYFKSR